jgi:hypothetical protein
MPSASSAKSQAPRRAWHGTAGTRPSTGGRSSATAQAVSWGRNRGGVLLGTAWRHAPPRGSFQNGRFARTLGGELTSAARGGRAAILPYFSRCDNSPRYYTSWVGVARAPRWGVCEPSPASRGAGPGACRETGGRPYSHLPRSGWDPPRGTHVSLLYCRSRDRRMGIIEKFHPPSNWGYASGSVISILRRLGGRRDKANCVPARCHSIQGCKVVCRSSARWALRLGHRAGA